MRGSVVWIRNLIRTTSRGARPEEAKTSRVSARSSNGQRRAGSIAGNAGNLPTAKSLAYETFLILEERKSVNIVNSEYVAAIELSRTIFRRYVIRILWSGAAISLIVSQVVRPCIKCFYK